MLSPPWGAKLAAEYCIMWRNVMYNVKLENYTNKYKFQPLHEQYQKNLVIIIGKKIKIYVYQI